MKTPRELKDKQAATEEVEKEEEEEEEEEGCNASRGTGEGPVR
eukprot:CAMPEP_0114537226 /NCGR_PEP_ID=MMETSP0109-20121206/29459_1 /TAXON_ID=29199 /ORGANISM="Chlorarachnion reptans, Strain CCCM449" /LENGTH=42 /DNA_ID= /DNA_START= /DNA_END= /DNA_ORIENTATION=